MSARALALAAVMAPAAALACGAFYASNIEVASDQKIVVVHRGGLETYVFRPHFCGTAKDFGVILPIPATLASNPALAENALFDDLDRYTTPETVEVCAPSGGGCGSKGIDSGAFEGLDGGSQDINVVNRGTVGIFDYVLLQATSAAAFTDWLDQNGYPRGPLGSDAYASYVSAGWYFVAFKVTADTVAPPAGQKLCGDLGPIQLSFAAARPVVPARIASVNGASGTWRVFTLAERQQRVEAQSTAFGSTLFFSRTVRLSELADFGALATAARDGERLTALDVTFLTGVTGTDIGLEDDPAQADFRKKITVS
ncbi:MAG: DUF2330 domain-containing protein, partial [Myxococcaceae bacterium]